MSRSVLPAIVLALGLSGTVAAQTPCGGGFSDFVEGVKAEAVADGIPRDVADSFFRTVRQDQSVLQRDRAQGFFTRPFIEFSRQLISQNRLDRGRQMARDNAGVFERAQREYGVAPSMMLSFLAFETDYGSFQGDFNTADALVTLAHDCRRPELFRPHVLAMIELYRRGMIDPANTTGAWAGEIGMVQMLPGDILRRGVDGDGDGRIDLRNSLTDAVLTGAAVLRHHGWRANEPWMHEVRIPQGLDLTQTGLRTEMSVAEWQRLGVAARHGTLPQGSMQASVILPQGHNGPAFMIFPNFRVLFEWNQSFTYVVTAAYFATRLDGAPIYDAGDPDPGLSRDQMRELQRRLQARGYDTGGTTGILGAMTRAAVQDLQAELGLPADGWPTSDLLGQL
ncbi:MAG: Membrane-bound lytic murein transglycosylase B [Rhodobacteraceae bacterium HLUCCA12]|nr:MAG: Membrane-bound lytic murein transglycosylase B [Rhodobacteraceae bacterium HLUCCA12]